MTEIPEHLLKRAQAAREKAAEEATPAAASGADVAASDPRIPAHLLERSRAAKAKTEGESAGGGLAVAEKVAALVAAPASGGGIPLVPARVDTRSAY